MNEKENLLGKVLRKDTAYATGCTDPIGIALAGAVARANISGIIYKITIEVSPNIFKNAMGVGIPGSTEKGIDFAAAMGIVTGKADAGLDVLNAPAKSASDEAAALLKRAETKVSVSNNGILLFISIRLDTDSGWVEAIIQDDYDHIERITQNGKDLLVGTKVTDNKEKIDLNSITVQDVFDFAASSSPSELSYLKEGVLSNHAAALRGISEGSSFGLGKALAGLDCTDRILNSFIKARAYTAGASDARMAGLPVRIMTVAGSGNHGITALLSVYAVWEAEGLDEDALIRGLTLSALMTIFIKWHIQRMSAFCGCAVAAATGAAAGITRMLGGSEAQAAGAMEGIMGSLTGMICDGAKETCSYKVSVAAGEAVLHSYFATQGISVHSPVGILSGSLKQSFLNMGLINDPGMKETDRVILDITRKIQTEIMENR
jgi:L-cysteine desulfidase